VEDVDRFVEDVDRCFHCGCVQSSLAVCGSHTLSLSLDSHV
jgi:hypothetical protein